MNIRSSEKLNVLHVAYGLTIASIDIINEIVKRHNVMFISSRTGVRLLVEDEWRAKAPGRRARFTAMLRAALGANAK